MTDLQCGDTLKAFYAVDYAQNIRKDHSLKFIKSFRIFVLLSLGIISCQWQLLYSIAQLLLDWFIGKGADTSQQPKPTNKKTEPWCKQFLYGIFLIFILLYIYRIFPLFDSKAPCRWHLDLNSCGARILLGTVVLLYRCSYSSLCTLVCRQTCGWPTLGKPWEHPYFWPMRAQVG